MAKDETLRALSASLIKIREIINSHDQAEALYEPELKALDQVINQFKQGGSLFEIPAKEMEQRVLKSIMSIRTKINDEVKSESARIDKERRGTQNYYETSLDTIDFKRKIIDELDRLSSTLSSKIRRARPEGKEDHKIKLMLK